MPKLEIVAFPIPTNEKQIEWVEDKLEMIASKGGELVTFMPTLKSDMVFGVFRVQVPGALRDIREIKAQD